MTPEFIGILTLGLATIGLLVAFWRDTRAYTNQGLAELRTEIRDSRAEARADNQALRDEVHTEIQNLRAGVHADVQNLRAEVHADIQGLRADNQNLRKDMQALTERMSRLEGIIEGLFVGRGARDRHDDAA